jgi:hypothetical protein
MEEMRNKMVAALNRLPHIGEEKNLDKRPKCSVTKKKDSGGVVLEMS